MKFSASVDKILSNEEPALDGFYDLLLLRYPEFREHFSGSDLKRQTAMLTMALVAVKQFPKLHAPARSYLHAIGTKHSRRGISPELYGKFVEVLVEKVAEFHGDDWNDDLSRQWTEALNHAVTVMQEQ